MYTKCFNVLKVKSKCLHLQKKISNEHSMEILIMLKKIVVVESWINIEIQKLKRMEDSNFHLNYKIKKKIEPNINLCK